MFARDRSCTPAISLWDTPTSNIHTYIHTHTHTLSLSLSLSIYPPSPAVAPSFSYDYEGLRVLLLPLLTDLSNQLDCSGRLLAHSDTYPDHTWTLLRMFHPHEYPAIAANLTRRYGALDIDCVWVWSNSSCPLSVFIL